MENNDRARPGISDTAWDMVYLAYCAIRQVAPEGERVARMNLEKLYALATFHSLNALMGTALRGMATGDMSATWETAIHRAIRKTVLFDVERAELIAFMEAERIWYMPLKGILLKDLYPVYGTRQMADNDILFDATRDLAVRDWFVNRGYDVEAFAQGVHDSYLKKPVYNFEMHRMLFSPALEQWHAYYADVKDRLVKDEGNDFGYHFTDEDAYIYFFAHAAKHFTGSGTGLRSLIDLYLYVAKRPNLNWEYVEAELRKLDLLSEERKMRALARALFGSEAFPSPTNLSGDQQALLASMISSGTYGTVENHVSNKLKQYAAKEGVADRRRAKLRYLWELLFPQGPEYRATYPFFYKHRWAKPLLPLYRLGRGLIHGRKRIEAEIKAVRKL